jgi:hypothetical protein
MRLRVVDAITDERIGDWDVGSDRMWDALHGNKRYIFRDWEKEKMGMLLNDDADERLRANRRLVDVPLTLSDQDIVLPSPFPLASGRLRYNCWFNYTIEKDKTGKGRSLIKWKLHAGEGRRSKVVTSGEYLTANSRISGLKILGYYKSPFENRIVIVVQNITYTSEMCINDFEYYGCHLDAGFK